MVWPKLSRWWSSSNSSVTEMETFPGEPQKVPCSLGQFGLLSLGLCYRKVTETQINFWAPEFIFCGPNLSFKSYNYNINKELGSHLQIQSIEKKYNKLDHALHMLILFYIQWLAGSSQRLTLGICGHLFWSDCWLIKQWWVVQWAIVFIEACGW